MFVLSVTSMGPICLEIMFRRGYPHKSSYRVIKVLRKQDIRKQSIFAFSDYVLLLVC